MSSLLVLVVYIFNFSKENKSLNLEVSIIFYLSLTNCSFSLLIKEKTVRGVYILKLVIDIIDLEKLTNDARCPTKFNRKGYKVIQKLRSKSLFPNLVNCDIIRHR